MTQNQAQQPAPPHISSSDIMAAMRWRCIGPPRGGRVVAVAGDPEDPMAFYFGACAGGVWKTTDGGTYLGERQRWLFSHLRCWGYRRFGGGSQRDLCRHG